MDRLCRSQTTKRQLKTSMHMYRIVLGQPHHSVYPNLDQLACFIQAHVGNTSIFLKVDVVVAVALDSGISRLCDLFHNLCNGNINIRRMPTSRFIRRIPASRFIQRIPAFRFIRQLTHWLCMPLFSSSANRCQHRPADTTHQTCELYTQVRQSH